MSKNKPYPESGIAFDYAEGNPQRFERKPVIHLGLNPGDTPYGVTPFLDHHTDCYIFYLTSRDNADIEPINLIPITAEAYQDNVLVQMMLVNAIHEYEQPKR